MFGDTRLVSAMNLSLTLHHVQNSRFPWKYISIFKISCFSQKLPARFKSCFQVVGQSSESSSTKALMSLRVVFLLTPHSKEVCTSRWNFVRHCESSAVSSCSMLAMQLSSRLWFNFGVHHILCCWDGSWQWCWQACYHTFPTIYYYSHNKFSCKFRLTAMLWP